MKLESAVIMIRIIGQCLVNILQSLGRAFIFFIKSIYHCFVPPYYFKIVLQQLIDIGFFSLPIVGLTAIFTGAVLILQTSLNSYSSIANNLLPGIVVISIVRELGPVLIGLIIAGRVGAAIAAEIGTMRITEQIDALVTLNTNPFKYLVAPRIIAIICVMPILILCADLVGIYGGYMVGTLKLGYNPNVYIETSIKFLHLRDVLLGLIKAIAFGFIISFIGCYSGFYCSESAKGVGVATTVAVVISSISVILLNYIITLLYL